VLGEGTLQGAKCRGVFSWVSPFFGQAKKGNGNFVEDSGCRIEVRHDRLFEHAGACPSKKKGGRAARVHPTSSLTLDVQH
jgi:hypothetical protein